MDFDLTLPVKKKKKEKIPEDKRDLARALLLAGSTYKEVAEALDISIGSVHNITREPSERLARRRPNSGCEFFLLPQTS